MDTLQRHTTQTGADSMNELKKIALQFEENIYTVAMNQQNYQRRISLKMLSLESKAIRPSNHSPSSSPGNNQRPLDPATKSQGYVLSRVTRIIYKAFNEM
uniref:Mediator complex subunit 15 KIX domain-containing protein n=1 Tax=Picea sitchensis TaxID=3332 RepID=D5ADA1_PICSI|nr:unknown [Picea sitchensis]